MIYVFKTELPNNKPIHIALLSIYGIGLSRSILICRKLGFLPTLKPKEMSNEQISNLFDIIQNLSAETAITNDLKKLVNQNENKLALISSYRGVRLKKGLPVRGQRTHTNAQTVSRFVNRYQEQQKSTENSRKKPQLRKKK